MTDGPLIVQSDKTLLLDVDHILSTECRRAIAPFAELEKSPEHIHTYRLTSLGLWNARAAGHDAEHSSTQSSPAGKSINPCNAILCAAATLEKFTGFFQRLSAIPGLENVPRPNAQ